jgi:hypothetical protein
VVVVVNPAVLAKDPCWEALLRLAVRLKAYAGIARLPPEVLQQHEGSNGSGRAGPLNELEQLLQQMRTLSVSAEEAGGSGGGGGARMEAAWLGSAVGIEGSAMRRLT